MLCEEYKKKSALERKQHVSDNKLCLNCLGRHQVSECASKKNCTACGGRHHSSLHDACREVEVAKTSHVTQRSSLRQIAVLLATARVRVADRHGVWHYARALIDQGSESSIISEHLAQRLRLPRSPASVAIFGVGGQRTGSSKGKVTLSLSPRSGGPALSVSALILPKVTIFAGGLSSETKPWPHIQDLNLANPDYRASDPVDILLGAEAYASILAPGLRKGRSREPVAQNTVLGWILSGSVNESTTGHLTHLHQCQAEEDLTTLVRHFWEQEEIPMTAATLSKEDQECEDHFASTHSRGSTGRYIVRLPLIEPLPDLAGTLRSASRLIKHMENKFARDSSFHTLYSEFMQRYEELGHMTRILPGDVPASRTCYLPHHGVIRETSTTTKLRVVFNGSSALPSGVTFNQHLRVGPNLLPALADILLQWRHHRYVLAADIEKMYRQIEVHPQDRDLQRILWRKNSSDDMSEFRLNTVTYGLACAPFLAIRTLRQLADDENLKYPLGAATLRRDVYMDDVLTGAATIPDAKQLQHQLIEICKAGGFPLKKWSANNASLLEALPLTDRYQQDAIWWQPGESHLTLGLRWHPHDDQFSFSTGDLTLSSYTKRAVLSLTAKLFDPLGWLAPSTVLAKIYFQSTWLLGIDWDTTLPDDQVHRWVKFVEELPLLEALRIPRWLATEADDWEIHGFADASIRAYAAVVYLRAEKEDGQVQVTLVAAKTKVAPLKQVSLPRLELSAATLLTRLVANIHRVLGAQTAPLHLWSDSTVALGWIRGHPTSWKTYVANRVSEIQTTLPNAVWHHVSGSDNPADCASRGVSPRELLNHSLWWQGPPWLRSERGPWANCTADTLEELPEQRTHTLVAATNDEITEPEMLVRYSTLHRLLRITARCRRWLRIHWPRTERTDRVLRAEELDEARLCWIRIVQAVHFKRELALLKGDKSLPARSILTKLNPRLDESGILRVGGRLRHADLAYDARHPMILPGTSHLTRLIIEACHHRTMHGGVQLTLSSLRQEFWIPRGRALVKNCIHRCLTCLRWRAATPQPPMGDLPPPRVTPCRPFINTGVNYAGPIWLRAAKGRGQKAYKAFITVFVCLSSRAVHLDVASDYSADAFLAALRRFVARRGLCQALYSDCGTNFVGADAQLRALFSASSREGQRIASTVAEERIRWHFNPPAAPNFGGIWEAAVKSMKHHLRRVIGDSTLTYEEMATLLAQIEACLNSRPLQALSDDPEDFSALTPGHLLVGSELNAVPEPSLAEAPPTRLSRWQLLQQIKDHFWQRWSREYLNTMAHRPKWHRTNADIRIRRLCLLRNETSPPTKWPLARIERLHPGEDGNVRVVVVRTATSSFIRPVNKLILLPDCTISEDSD